MLVTIILFYYTISHAFIEVWLVLTRMFRCNCVDDALIGHKRAWSTLVVI